MQTQQCPNCGKTITDKFCSHCGEQAFSSKKLSALFLLNELFSSLTDVDSKLLKSLKLLFTKPGQLTLDYCRGVRKNRLNPFQIFLFANICYFLFIAVLNQNTFTTALEVHLNSKNFIHQELAIELVEEKLANESVSLQEFSQKFNQRIEIQSKTLLLVLIPLFAIVVVIANFKHRFSIVTALVFSAHFVGFLLFFQIVYSTFLYAIFSLLKRLELLDILAALQTEMVYSVLLFFGICFYLYLASIRVFSINKQPALIQTLFYGLAIYWIILIYRMILFFTTFYSL